MKLAVLNGSPRGDWSNSIRMARWVTKEAPVYNLDRAVRHEEVLEGIRSAEAYLIVIPLYVDSMPAQVKAFLELMEKNRDDFSGKRICYIVHSGFPEAIHSYNLRDYLEYYSELMDMDYLGTLIMAGSESLQMAPDKFFRKKMPFFKQVNDSLLKGEKLPEGINRKMNRVEKHSPLGNMLYGLFPFKNWYWHHRAKQHGTKESLRARPY
ncbi:MAG: NAD(P)H-dependent oxidoreductase [Spirochaetales bacterium]|nr:NAD(P)H-dependent oxidoreductase [Spirochaetales bacterium]